MIWEFIAAEKASLPIVFMCAEFGVSRQGYYAWERRVAAGGSAQALADANLTERIRVIFARHRGRYGSPGSGPSWPMRGSTWPASGLPG